MDIVKKIKKNSAQCGRCRTSGWFELNSNPICQKRPPICFVIRAITPGRNDFSCAKNGSPKIQLRILTDENEVHIL